MSLWAGIYFRFKNRHRRKLKIPKCFISNFLFFFFFFLNEIFNLGNRLWESKWKRLFSAFQSLEEATRDLQKGCVQGPGGTAPGAVASHWQKAARKLDFIMYLHLCAICFKFCAFSGESNSQLYWPEGGKKFSDFRLLLLERIARICHKLVKLGQILPFQNSNSALTELCCFLHLWTCFPTFLLLIARRKCHASSWSSSGTRWAGKAEVGASPGLCPHELWMRIPWSWGSCSFSNKLVGQIKTRALISAGQVPHLHYKFTYSRITNFLFPPPMRI